MAARLALLATLALAANAALPHRGEDPKDPTPSSASTATVTSSNTATVTPRALAATTTGAGSTMTAVATRASAAPANAADSGGGQILTDQVYAFSAIPFQVNPYSVGRGPQTGYNICNATTAGAASECQTLIMNDIDDFCIWGSATPDATIGDIEAAVVAYCTPKNAHGSRVFPDGTITGLQWITTSAYIQITGFLDQTKIGLQANDTGGELDPHGADLMGNPVGGLVYSTNINGGNNVTLEQVINWNNFVGSGAFCIKLCANSITSPDYCQNKFDLLGCSYNMPSANVNGEFTKCDGALQDEVGKYVGADGVTSVYSQPASLAPGDVVPYTPRVPASSNCVTYQSTQLFGGATSTSSVTSASATATGSAATSGSAGATNAAAVASNTNKGTAGAAAASASATTSGGVFSGARGGDAGSAAVTLVVGFCALVAGAVMVV